MKLNYNLKGLSFKSASLQEAMTVSECFQAENVNEERHSWHFLLTREHGNVQDLTAVDSLRLWGLEPSEGLDTVQRVLDSKRKQYKWDTTPLEEVKLTPAYKRALELVTSRFGKPLKDGRILFPYQIETAAMMIAKKRLLLALDMGLGSVLCSVTN